MRHDLSKEELIQLDMAIMDRAMLAKLNARGRGQKNNQRLAEHIEQLDQLHTKLKAFLEQTSQQEGEGMGSYNELTPEMKKYVEHTIHLIQDDAYWADGVAPGEDNLRERLSDLVVSVLNWQEGEPTPLPPRTNPHD